MDYKDFENRKYGSLFVGGVEFPNVPFQMTVVSKEYCKRYSLPYMTALTVTAVRYSKKNNEIMFSVLDAVFDFPWKEKACEPMNFYFPN